MRGTTQKLKLLYLKEIFEEETDNEHAVSMPTIIEELEKRGVPAERKSIYDDIRLLQDQYGLPIAHEDGARTYRLEEHDFEFSELKLIIDAVSSCKTLSEKKSLQLRDGDTHFTITEPIAVSPQFFAWMFGLGEKAEIVAPVEVRNQMRVMMERSLHTYAHK